MLHMIGCVRQETLDTVQSAGKAPLIPFFIGFASPSSTSTAPTGCKEVEEDPDNIHRLLEEA